MNKPDNDSTLVILCFFNIVPHIFTFYSILLFGHFSTVKVLKGMNTWHQYICSKLWIIFHPDRRRASRVNECFLLDRAAAHTCGGSDWILRRRADQRARQHNSICVQLCPCALGSCWFSWLTKDESGQDGSFCSASLRALWGRSTGANGFFHLAPASGPWCWSCRHYVLSWKKRAARYKRGILHMWRSTYLFTFSE